MASRHGCYYHSGHGVQAVRLMQRRRQQQYPSVTKLKRKERSDAGTFKEKKDGSTHPDKNVTNGTVTLERGTTHAHIGFGYKSLVKTLRLEGGAEDGVSQGKIKRIHGVTARFLNTVGAEIGPDTSNLDRLPFRDSSMAMDEAVPLFTGDKEVSFPSGYDNDAQIVIQQSQPLPMTILAIMRRSNTFDA